MINLQTFFKNPFDSNRIGDDNLRKFGEDHLQRTVANNGGSIYTTLITPTRPLVLAFGQAIDDESGRAAIQKADTLRVDNLIDKFKKTTSRREGAIRSAFGEGSPEYLEFFPLGLTEYSDANKANVVTLMRRMKEGATRYTSELGSAIVEEFSNILSEYERLRERQLLAFGDVERLRTATSTAREALVDQLGINLLFIAGKNLRHPDRLDDS